MAKKLGRSEDAVLTHVKAYPGSTPAQVGLALYDNTSLAAKVMPKGFYPSSVKRSWAGKVLNSLKRKGLVYKDGRGCWWPTHADRQEAGNAGS